MIPLDEELTQLAEEWPLCRLLALEPDDIVVVAGAYKGRVMDLLLRLYDGISVVGYEPADWARIEAWKRLADAGHDVDGRKIAIHAFGIGVATENGRPMGEWGTDGCSFVNVGDSAREHGVGDLRDWRDIPDLALRLPALYILNMEGYEFELLDDMLRDSGDPLRDSALAVQWHTAYGRRELTPELFVRLAKSHRLVWNRWPQWTYHVPLHRLSF